MIGRITANRANPVRSGLKPSRSWKCREANSTPASSPNWTSPLIAAFPRNGRRRSRWTSISGSSATDWRRTKTTDSSTPAVSRAIVSGEVQDHRLACWTASTVSPTSPTSNSNEVGLIVPGRPTFSGRAMRTMIRAAMPSGTFSQNTARHATTWVSTPPSSGPAARNTWLMPT